MKKVVLTILVVLYSSGFVANAQTVEVDTIDELKEAILADQDIEIVGNIDASSANYENWHEVMESTYTKTLDGNNYTISNFYIRLYNTPTNSTNIYDGSDLGLITGINKGTIKNLKMEMPQFFGQPASVPGNFLKNIGLVTGNNQGNIENVHINVPILEIQGQGLDIDNPLRLENYGGIAGFSTGKITHATLQGGTVGIPNAVSASNTKNQGGIVGNLDGSEAILSQSWTTNVLIMGAGTRNVGGLVGTMGENTYGSVNNSFVAKGNIISEGSTAGGVVGLAGRNANIEAVYSEGQISTQGIKNEITARNMAIGGIVGKIIGEFNNVVNSVTRMNITVNTSSGTFNYNGTINSVNPVIGCIDADPLTQECQPDPNNLTTIYNDFGVDSAVIKNLASAPIQYNLYLTEIFPSGDETDTWWAFALRLDFPYDEGHRETDGYIPTFVRIENAVKMPILGIGFLPGLPGLTPGWIEGIDELFPPDGSGGGIGGIIDGGAGGPEGIVGGGSTETGITKPDSNSGSTAANSDSSPYYIGFNFIDKIKYLIDNAQQTANTN